MNSEFKNCQLKNGEVLSYRQLGQQGQDTLLFIHGNHTGQQCWDEFCPALQQQLQQQGKSYQLITLDMRGFGRSSYNQKSENLEDQADDIIDFINILNLKRVTLLGWSTGGGVSMIIQTKIPQIIQKIVLISSISYKGFQFLKKDKKTGKHFVRDTAELRLRLQQMLTPLFENNDKATQKEMMENFLSVGMFSESQNNPEGEFFDRIVQEAIAQKNYVDANIGLHTFGYFKSNPNMKVRCPTFLIHGEQDPVIPIEQGLQNYEFIGANLTKKLVIADCAHSPIFSHKNQLVQQISQFLNELSPKL